MRVKHDRQVDDAFSAVDDDPDRAVALAESVLDAPDATPTQQARARWARGMARREQGEMTLGAEDLFAARQAAAGLGDDVLTARIDISLAIVALYTGSATGALEVLAQAAPHLHGADLARLESQRGLIHHRSGELAAAERDYRAALRRSQGADDPIGRARLLLNLGVLYGQRGNLALSERRLLEAVDVASAAGQRFLAAAARHNLGYARSRAGRMSDALDDMAAAESLLAGLGRPELLATAQADRAELLLRCNLLGEACDAADQALEGIRRHGNETDLADAALLAARCRLAAGRLAAAREAAAESATSLARQQRSSWLALAEFVQAEIDAAEHPDDHVAGEELWDVSGRLERHGWSGEAMAARVLAGQLMLRGGDVERAAAILGGLRVVADRPAGERASAYLARGLLDEARGDRRGAQAAVRNGLRVVAENQASVGGFEFRTFAAGHGAPLVELGARLAVADQRPRELLERLEATRRMLWLLPRATPPSDEVLAGLLAELRLTTEKLRAAIGSGADQGSLRGRRLDLEHRIRHHTSRSRAVGDMAAMGVADAAKALGDRALVQYAVVDARLHAVTIIDRRAVLHDLGPTDGLGADVDACAFALHRLNRAQGSAASRAAAASTLDELGRALEDRLVPARVRGSARPLVVVPAGELHGLAWGALPALAGRSVSVSPSLIGWAVAAAADATGARPGGVLVAGGPGLPGAVHEVAAVAALHRRSRSLVGDDATAERTLHELGRSRLAHLACHGSFRADNPLFSTLALADGPLTVYDLERCRALPRTVVLSACNVATSSVLRGGTLLGLGSALMTFGASTVIAPLTPVNDERVVPVMVDLHRRMAAGEPPAAALAAASAGDDGRVDPTAATFIAIGA